MNILIFGINYAPELTGIGKYTGEMAEWLSLHGHSVTVITSMPYYPEWKISADYSKKSKWFLSEQLNGVNVLRVPMYVPEKPTSKRRILHEFSFLFSAALLLPKLIFSRKYDVVISIAPPFHLASLPLIYSKLKGSKLWTHVQDLQVDAAANLGMIRHQHLIRFLLKAERTLLNNSNVVSTISEGMMRKIWEKNIRKDKTFLLPNWVDQQIVYPVSAEHSLRQELGISAKKKVILYSGNLGEKQGLEILIPTAKRLSTQEDLLFVIAGSGGMKDQLIQMAKKEGLQNIMFVPLQPLEKLSRLLGTADVHLVLQKKSASDLVMPSKLTGILAAGGCAVVSALPQTSLYDVVDTYKLGILISPESAEALCAGIQKALQEGREKYQKNALWYAANFLNRDRILQHFEQRMQDLAHGFPVKNKKVPFL